MKLNKLLLLLGLTALSFTACDEYGEGERWDIIPVTVKKNVLLEDFTGQYCSNCPDAANIAHELQNKFGADHLVVVALHGGPQSASVETDEGGLANEESRAYNTQFMGRNSYPMGSIDRSEVMQRGQWAAAVLKRMSQQPKVDLTIDNNNVTYDAATKKLSVKVDVKANAAVEGNLQMWLIEDNVTSYQLSTTEFFDNYTHQHVFRATLNGLNGDALTLANEQTAQKEYTYTLPDFSVWKNNTPWKAQDLSIVAFFYNATDGVMQVISHKVINQ